MKKLFDEIPYMDHDRLVLKKLEETDSEALLELIRSDNVYRYLPSFLFERQFGDDMHEMIRELYSARVLEKNGFIMTAHTAPEDWGYREPTPVTNGSAEQIIDASISCRIRAEACVPSGMHT